MIVIDANIALSWFVDEEPPPESEAVLDYLAEFGALVPGNFYSEITHGFLRAERRMRTDESLSVAALSEIMALDISVELPEPHLVLALGRKHGLTCYDASYLALAIERELPLATADTSLRSAARALKLSWSPSKRRH